MDARSISDFVVDVEQRFPVDHWQAQGIAIWPLLRIQLYFKLFNRALLRPGDHTPMLMERLKRRSVRQMDIRLRGARAARTDAARTPSKNSPAEVVFVSDGVSQLRVEQGWFDRFCDPIAVMARKRGLRTFTITLGDAFNIPRVGPGVFLQPHMERLKIEALFRSLLPGKGLTTLQPEINALNKWLGGIDPSLKFSPRKLGAQVTALRLIAESFEQMLAMRGARVAFVVSYYNMEGMAFCHAARTLGIRTFELQHGVAGEFHAAYGRWTRLPPNGYSLLPEIFWAWSPEDADFINSWAMRTSGAHRAEPTGNVFVTGWRGGLVPKSPDLEERVRKLVDLEFSASHYLVALQPGLMDENTLKPLLQAAARIGKQACWWFRLHPMNRDQGEPLRHMLQKEGLTNVEIEEASELPLLALLPEADVVLTHSSSTVLEAEAFGVPSVIMSQYGADLFPLSLSKGTARAAFSPDAIVDALQGFRDFKRGRQAAIADGLSMIESALDTIPPHQAGVPH